MEKLAEALSSGICTWRCCYTAFATEHSEEHASSIRSTVVLQPTENSIRDDPDLQALITSTPVQVGPGVRLDDLRENNAANVYLYI